VTIIAVMPNGWAASGTTTPVAIRRRTPILFGHRFHTQGDWAAGSRAGLAAAPGNWIFLQLMIAEIAIVELWGPRRVGAAKPVTDCPVPAPRASFRRGVRHGDAPRDRKSVG